MTVAALVVAHSLIAECARPGADDPPNKRLTTAQRAALIKRAQVWNKTDVASLDLRKGPDMKGAFKPGETVSCDYVNERFAGNTPKFACDISHEDHVKVRFGRENGEVYAGVAATRLLWALGFGADALYPVHVVCRGCPPEFAAEGQSDGSAIRFDIAAIERKMPGHELEAPSVGSGWAWPELDFVDERAGGAPAAQRDALKLLAVFLQHTDSKAEQQRLLCLDTHLDHDAADCKTPFMMIHDVGLTFGRANQLNRNNLGSVNLERWTGAPIWRDAAHCVANLSPSQTGTLAHPIISEAGRQFLAGLLGKLSDDQLRDLFEVSRFADRVVPGGTGGSPVPSWVDAFKKKRQEIASTVCP